MCDAGEDDVEATAIIAIVAKVDSSKMNRYLQDQWIQRTARPRAEPVKCSDV